jgi:tetratricopeptide (TPR) repeat protein
MPEDATMPRGFDRDDPLSTVRRLVHRPELRAAAEIALYRLPERQREIVRRYDLYGERAKDVQQALGISQRQFFRDRRRALAVLRDHFVEDDVRACGRIVLSPIGSRAKGDDLEVAGRAFARSLAQSGNARSLDVLRKLASAALEPQKRADILLEMAEIAVDYGSATVANEGAVAAFTIVREGDLAPSISSWLLGRLARVNARVAKEPCDGVEHFTQATELLRSSIAADPAFLEPRMALAETLGDAALLQFNIGAFAAARAASSEAAEIIGAFGLSNRPQALEAVGVRAAIDASFSGRTRAAVCEVSELLRQATDSGWPATVCGLGALLVGLNGIAGDYAEAIRWYRTTHALALESARPGDRAGLALEAAHAYTMFGLPNEALSALEYATPGEACPRPKLPNWHYYWHHAAAAALQRRGDNEAALAEAREALASYSARRLPRGIGDAHRLIATCHAKLGNARAAREHVGEARRLTERHGTPYAMLRTLTAEAAILQNANLEREAIEYANLLQRLAHL